MQKENLKMQTAPYFQVPLCIQTSKNPGGPRSHHHLHRSDWPKSPSIASSHSSPVKNRSGFSLREGKLFGKRGSRSHQCYFMACNNIWSNSPHFSSMHWLQMPASLHRETLLHIPSLTLCLGQTQSPKTHSHFSACSPMWLPTQTKCWMHLSSLSLTLFHSKEVGAMQRSSCREWGGHLVTWTSIAPCPRLVPQPPNYLSFWVQQNLSFDFRISPDSVTNSMS